MNEGRLLGMAYNLSLMREAKFNFCLVLIHKISVCGHSESIQIVIDMMRRSRCTFIGLELEPGL